MSRPLAVSTSTSRTSCTRISAKRCWSWPAMAATSTAAASATGSARTRARWSATCAWCRRRCSAARTAGRLSRHNVPPPEWWMWWTVVDLFQPLYGKCQRIGSEKFDDIFQNDIFSHRVEKKIHQIHHYRSEMAVYLEL